MGILSNLFGQSDAFYARDFRNAYHLRPDINPPRQKFQGYVNFILNREIFKDLYPGENPNTGEYRTKISSLVRKFNLPEIDFKTETKNQYNRKRIVNTGLEYTPVNITVMDTVGNEWYTLLMRYYAYHYMNPRNKVQTDNRDIVDKTFNNENFYNGPGFGKGTSSGESSYLSTGFDSNAFGRNINPMANFFERIDMILYHGNKGVQYSLMSPVLTALKTGDVDYSDSNVLEFDLTFEYENFVPYVETNFGLTAFDLNRFENAGGFTGDAFSTDGKPIGSLESNKITALGDGTAYALRSSQPAPADTAPQQDSNPRTKNSTVNEDGTPTGSQNLKTPIDSADPNKIQKSAESDQQIASEKAAGLKKDSTVNKATVQGGESSQLPSIYGDAATFSNQADLTKSSMWGEIFKSTVNNGLVAAINGGSVKNAVINTLVGGVVSQGEALALNIRSTPATGSQTNAQSTRPPKPAPAVAEGSGEQPPVLPTGTGPE